jgi:hypothetical protein
MPSRRSSRPRSPTPAVLLRHLVAIVAVIVVAGCSGGGCGGGCSSCGGITPLAGGFDTTKRIENAGSVRLTKSGLDFVSKNIGTLAKGILGGMGSGGVITFDVPQSSGTGYSLCPNGSNPNANPKVCVAEIDVGNANLTVTTAGPDDVHVTGTLPLRVEDLEVSALGCTETIAIGGSDNHCPADSYDALPVDVDIQVQVDQNMAHTAGFGYTALTIKSIIDQNAVTSNLDNQLQICGGGFLCGTLLGSILNLVKSPIINALFGQLQSTLQSQVANQLCQKSSMTTPCPTGTTPNGSGICSYADGSCASILLGTDGHINLGALLAKLSPGTTGGLDFIFTAGGQDKSTNNPNLAWGDLNPVAGGATIGLFGGAEPNPISGCVPLSQLALPTGIPIPDTLYQDSVPNWPANVPGPHVGIAVSERFTNYALSSLYNSGMLCIGISTESEPLLTSGAIGLLAPSVKDLGLQHEPQQVGIVIRPSAPPVVTFGNGTDPMMDPNVLVTMKAVSLDFYIFSLDRFIRFMTATYDLSVPVELSVGPDGLTPGIANIGVNNGMVTNNQLLREMPATLASAIGGLIGSLVGQQLGSAIKPVNINTSLMPLGIELIIPDSTMGMGSPGLVKLSQGSDNYLGIFAALALAGTPIPGVPPKPKSVTNVEVTRKVVDPAGMRFKTLTDDNVPVVELHALSNLDDGSRAIEFQYRIDHGVWHPFTRDRFLTLRDPWLRVQGRHTVYVRSRVAGEPTTLDPNPAEAEVVIDVDPPTIQVGPVQDGHVTIDVADRITTDPMVRYRLDQGAWSGWKRASLVGPIAVRDAAELSVEAKDTEGNVGTLQADLLRGRADGLTGSSCGCVVAGDDRAPHHALFVFAAALAGLGARLLRRKADAKRALGRAAGGVATVAVLSSWAGCSCGNNSMTQTSGTTSGTSSSSSSSTGGYSCDPPTCTTLQPGLIGEYSSAAVAGTDIWVAGYSEADWDNDITYGDLVAGKWDGTKVDWNQVDGVPSTPPVDPKMYNIKGFRGGQTAPGDDVGLWASIAIGGDNFPAIAYYDRTNHALKFAQFDGKQWGVQTVDSGMMADVGRYAKMLFVNGAFVIAYQSIAPGGTNGALTSKVRVATSMSATPTSGGWTFEDAAVVNTTPCRAQFCASTEACVVSTGQCTATVSSCSPSCASGQACVGSTPACVNVYDSSKLDAYPDAIGDYISASPDGQGGVGVAYYDRTNGNLMIAQKSSGMWSTLLVDGEGAMSGDSGIGTSLFIDTNGDWNITYVNGYTEALQYVKVTGGKTVGTPEIVDTGLAVGGMSFTDGQHLVGDDSHILVLPSGEVHVTYQDATAGTLHYAVGMPGATTGHTWTTQAITQDGFAGAFSSIVVSSNQLQLMNWWRVGGMTVQGDVRLLAPQ